MIFFLSHDLARGCDQRVICLYDCEPLIVSHHPATFHGHRQCSSGDIMGLVCHLILQYHVTKRSGNFMGRSSLREVIILSSLMAIGNVEVHN